MVESLWQVGPPSKEEALREREETQRALLLRRMNEEIERNDSEETRSSIVAMLDIPEEFDEDLEFEAWREEEKEKAKEAK